MEMQREKTGFIGLGAMGGRMATTLVRSFYDLLVFDLDPGRIATVAAIGATAAENAEQVARECDVVALSLPSSDVTVRVLEEQILPSAREGTVVIDLGTTVASQTRRLHALFAERGAHLLDAPVSGGAIGCALGSLYCFVGGDREPAERVWPILTALASARLTYCGPSGCGQITKGVNQLAMGFLTAAYSEAIAYGVTAGVDEATLMRAVGGEAGFRAQFQEIAIKVLAGAGDAMDHKYAEFDYFLDEADRVGFDAPILRALNDYLSPHPATGRDNMGRPFPPLWSRLTGTDGGDAS